MTSPEWESVLAASADPARARHHFGLLASAIDNFRLRSVHTAAQPWLAALLAGSRALTETLLRHPDWLELFADPDEFRFPRRRQGLERQRDQRLGGNATIADEHADGALDSLHSDRLRELLRIGVRDLARLATTLEIVREVSDVTDVFLDGILRLVAGRMIGRFGSPWELDPAGTWRPSSFSVVALGKLGGQELNYASDVDLLFISSGDGHVFRSRPRRGSKRGRTLTSQAYFQRLAESLIREATHRGVQSGALRIDVRLRPEGNKGALVRSLDSYENYYAAAGQTWERMMLLKARGTAGNSALAADFLERIQPFRYPRSIDDDLLEEMADMKARSEAEIVRSDELDRNVKLGRGGIREIEFVAQAIQVLNGGRNPFVQSHQTIPALEKLASYQLLPDTTAVRLIQAYPFLRDLEHRLQMDAFQQLHTLPTDHDALLHIARLNGFRSVKVFQAKLREHTRGVRSAFERVFRRRDSVSKRNRSSTPLSGFAPVPRSEVLQVRGFRDPAIAARLLSGLVDGPAHSHQSPRTRRLGRKLVTRFLEACPGESAAPFPTKRKSRPIAPFQLSDPDRVLARLDSYVGAYGARASLLELWSCRPMVLDHLLKLFDHSEFLAELAIRVPDLVDGLEAGSHIQRPKSRQQTLHELRLGADDADQSRWMRRYFHTEFMRLGLRDILGIVDAETANTELTALADACLIYALEVVTKRHRERSPPLAIVGLGKLGGGELGYGSDLDVLFVARDTRRNASRLQRMATDVIELLANTTEDGTIFAVDTRLRPDGTKGLLVQSLRAYQDYYRSRADLWEIQALTRVRIVGGDSEVGRDFEVMARRLTSFRPPVSNLAAWTTDWKLRIAQMRQRIEKERTQTGEEPLTLKTGAGGLIDAEFLAQMWAMDGGWFEPNTVTSLRRAQSMRVLPNREAEQLIGCYQKLHRVESVLRRWSFEGESSLPRDPAAQHRVAIRCGYPNAAGLLRDITAWRATLRRIFTRYFGAP